jgi:hypothetical protein
LVFRVDPKVGGQDDVVVRRARWIRLAFTEFNEAGGYLLGKEPQFDVGVLGSPLQHFEGSWLIDSVDHHQHALRLLDYRPVLGESGDGCGHLVLACLFGGGDVDVEAVGADDGVVTFAQQKVANDHDVMYPASTSMMRWRLLKAWRLWRISSRVLAIC